MISNKSKILLIIFIFNFNAIGIAQNTLNPNSIKKILFEYGITKGQNLKKRKALQITYNQYFYNNSNLANFENQNGIHMPKGFGFYTGMLYEYSNNNIYVSFEPRISKIIRFSNSTPKKDGTFSVLNDAKTNESKKNSHMHKNTGIKINLKNVLFSYGNWNQWWGPGVHNSLSLSNNSEGFYNYSISFKEDLMLFPNGKFNFSYMVSSPFINEENQDFFLSSLKGIINWNNLELGLSRDILSGGYDFIDWGLMDAAKVILFNNNMKYWDQINTFYLHYFSRKSGLNIFIERGIPNRSYGDNDPKNYPAHNVGTNLGIRKYGVFGNPNILLGFEYTKLLQSPYFNLIPSPNWYDNKKYNFYSYKGKRWTAHSGSDSDDVLMFFGLINDKWSLIYGFNYERHGVTYNFPPEVKFENRFTATIKNEKIFISLFYENEFFEHYAFLDNNYNVWTQTYEKGSLQRTKSVLIKIEYLLN